MGRVPPHPARAANPLLLLPLPQGPAGTSAVQQGARHTQLSSRATRHTRAMRDHRILIPDHHMAGPMDHLHLVVPIRWARPAVVVAATVVERRPTAPWDMWDRLQPVVHRMAPLTHRPQSDPRVPDHRPPALQVSRMADRPPPIYKSCKIRSMPWKNGA